MLNVLCVHGVGHEEAHPQDWQPIWESVIQSKMMAGGLPPVNIYFAEYDRVFEDVIKNKLTMPQIINTILTADLDSVVTFPDNFIDNETNRWTAGMVSAWLSFSSVRTRCRAIIADWIEFLGPCVVIAHSLGGDIMFDTLKQNPILRRYVALVTAGSQVGNLAVRTALGGLEPFPTGRWWYHLYNPNDHVFTASVAPYLGSNPQRFTEFNIPFGTYITRSLTTNHSMVPAIGADKEEAYLTNNLTDQWLWPLLRHYNFAAIGLPYFGNPMPGATRPKATLFFDTGKKVGFTETYFHTSNSTLAEVLADALILGQARVGILGNDVKLYEIRVTDEAQPRAVEKVFPNAPDGLKIDKKADFGAQDETYKSIYCEAQGALAGAIPDGAYSDKRYFAGIPDSCANVPSTDVNATAPGFPAAFAAFAKALCNGKWGYWPYSKNLTDHPKAKISKIVVSDLFATITTAAPHKLAVTDRVRISGVLTTEKVAVLNGVYGPYFNLISATSLSFPTTLADGTTFRNLGFVHGEAQEFVPYLILDWAMIVRRKRGTGCDRVVGRRKSSPSPQT